MPEFRLTPAAERDLEGIWEYTAGQWSVSQAERYTDTLLQVFQDLADDPLGIHSASCEHLRPGYRRRRVERHFVYFKPTEYGAAIIRVLHVSRHVE